MDEKITISGVIKEISRHRTEWGHRSCSFILENNISVSCEHFIPTIRQGWAVRVIGEWIGADKDRFIADEVERCDNRTMFCKSQKQTKLTEFKRK
jgi:hypothetical protein